MSALRFCDSHCHLDWFAQPQAIAHAAQSCGVDTIVVPAVSVSRWADVQQVAQQTGVLAAYGLHPLYQAEHQPEHLAQLYDWIVRERPVAIGECGLDYGQAGGQSALEQQQLPTFIAQLELAKRFDLPLLLHARKSLDAVLLHLKRLQIKRFVIHSFTGSDQQLQHIFALGGYIGIGGTSTYPRAQRLQRQLAHCPPDRYMLETDAPDQPLCGRQGIDNTPDQIPTIATHLAYLRGVTVEEISAQAYANSQRFFAQTG